MPAHRKEKIGIVTSDKADKTVLVKVERLIRHPLYKKVIKRAKKYMVHDETNTASNGDKIKFIETRPLSKRKCWKLVNILEKASVEKASVEEEDTTSI